VWSGEVSAQHLVHVSGGKDSDCCYLLAVERGRPFRAIMADTGNEHEWTYEHAALLSERTGGPEVEMIRQDFTAAIMRRRDRLPVQWAAAGVPQSYIDRALELLWPTGNPYLDLVLSKGMFAARARKKFCTEELKIRPSDEQVVDPLLAMGRSVVQWFGIRADESVKRANEISYPKVGRGPRVNGARLIAFRPILGWSLDDVVAFHKRHGLPMNPLYAMGMKRVGCFPCVNENKASLSVIARKFPEHIDRIREWEQIVSQVSVGWRKAASFRDISTFFPAGTVPGLHRNTIDDMADWSITSRGGRQYNMHHEFGPIEDQQWRSCTGGRGDCEAA
jgi:3'-phosphoadenosine 5'-phosphosulfate sulfotransferase (PAPS reductase)/FAD synthetase